MAHPKPSSRLIQHKKGTLDAPSSDSAHIGGVGMAGKRFR